MNTVKINTVKSNPNNPRLIKDDKFKKLVKSLREFPEMAKVRPIVVNQDMVVLGGNMRLKGMKEAGWKDVPIEIVDWSEDKQREFIIKDNVGFGEWEWELLANEWDAEDLEGWGLEIPDFDGVELEAEEDDFDVPDGGIETDIVLGDIFEIGEHRLLCGDSTDSDQVAKLMDGEKADLGLTDPPYNIGYDYNEHKDDMSNNEYNDFIVGYVNNMLINSDKQIITSGKQNVAYYYRNFDITEFAVWYAKNKMSGSKISNLGLCEPILFIGKFNRNARPTDMFEYTVKQQEDVGGHTCPKVLAFWFEIIKCYSENLIFDSFLGSGTTMVAAHQLKRKCYGMELDPKYCQVIVDRMIKLDPTLDVKKNGEKYEVNSEVTANG